ncbi:RNA polymerase sigma factor [Pseudoxanthomonas koreensis]|uniref:RNA polymerase sigma factor n=1 Tax=Pseudoxanthomonas koreensis TaxID=266061 RepID=UPI0013916386|nr:sigma-70 family RNA polymerase sigma factor [Pseudoxanthomonas koreensis]KAF1694939.1 RNA polymerase subunit sigma-70 [Pseudoxanthomonas koreensis]
MNAETLDLMLRTELPAARRGNREAFGRIVSACQNTVTAIALAITRDVQASEDIAQEAFLSAWQRLDRLRNSASFLPWLRQITRNLARDWLRAQAQRPLSGEAAEIAIGMAADPSPEPSDRLLRGEAEAAAEDIISALPEDSREVLLLFYREGQRSRQVAALLGLSDEVVRKRLSRARTSVREELVQRFGEFARSTAPSAAFGLALAGALATAVPATATAAVVGSGVLGTGAGKLGMGGLATGGAAGGVAGGSLGLIVQTLTQQPGLLPGIVVGTIAGALVSALTWWYLARFCQTPREAGQIRRFMRLSAVTGALLLLCLMLAVVFGNAWVAVTVAVVGLAVANYQHLVVLRRIMEPILAHPANASRRGEYGYVMGAKSAWLGTAIALAAIVFALYRQGRF